MASLDYFLYLDIGFAGRNFFVSGDLPNHYLLAMTKSTFTLWALLFCVFTFTFESYSQSPSTFASLSRKLDAGYYTPANGTLRFLFEEEYSVAEGTPLSYKILDALNKPVTNPTVVTVERGINKCEVNVSSLTPGYYIMEVSNAKNEKWYLRFKVA